MHVIIPDVFLEDENLPTILEVFAPSFLLREPAITQEWKEIFETFPKTWKCLKVDENEILLFQKRPHEKLKLVKIEDDNTEHIGEGAFGSVQKVQVGDIGLFAVKEVDLTPEDARTLLQRETAQEIFTNESAQSAQLEKGINLLREAASAPPNRNVFGTEVLNEYLSSQDIAAGHAKFMDFHNLLPDNEYTASIGKFAKDIILATDVVPSDEVMESFGVLGNPTKIDRSRLQKKQKEAKTLNNHDFLARFLTTSEQGASGDHNFPTSTWIKIDLGPPVTVTLVLLSPFYPFTLEDYIKQKCVTQAPKDNFMRTVIAELMHNLLRQVSTLHGINYIHSDIKPTNIFGDPLMYILDSSLGLSKGAEQQVPQLLKSPASDDADLENIIVFYPHLGDFSVAHILPAEEQEDMVGRSYPPCNAQYCAPELDPEAQKSSRKPRSSKASDIYALGVIFWELLTGKPYEGDERNVDLEKLYKKEAGVISQMLEPDPSKRIQASECSKLIEKLLSELNGPEYRIKRAGRQEIVGQKFQEIGRLGMKAIFENLRKKSHDELMEYLRKLNPEVVRKIEDMRKVCFGDYPVPEFAKEATREALVKKFEEILALHGFVEPNDEGKEIEIPEIPLD